MKPRFRKGVFIVVHKIENGKLLYLILKRNLHWSGWELPKGGVEKFETRKMAVRRELKEETGLKPLKIKRHNYAGKYLYPKPLKDRPGIIGQTFSLYSVEVKAGKVHIDRTEDKDYKWLLFPEASKKLTWKDQKESLKIVNNWITSRLK